MSSPAQRHRMIHHALARSAAAQADTPAPDTSPYQLMLAKLAEDKRVLKSTQSLEQKILIKSNRLPEYEAWVTGWLQADKPAQDDVVATLLVWYIDTGHIQRALDIGAVMLDNGLQLPDRFQRDLATLLVEEIAECAAAPDGDLVTDEQLLAVGALTDGRDMPDEVRAKLHKILGLRLRERAPKQALEHLQRALRLNPRIGVKTEIGKLTKQLAPAT
jgi:hypothetical protein